MKRLFTLLLLVSVFGLQATASAQSAPFQTSFDFFKLTTKPTVEVVLPPKPIEPPKPPEPVVYLVVGGDNLTKIGTAYNVEWQRLWAKNTELTNPDLIHVGDKITIPEPSEQLSREIPAVVALPTTTPGVAPVRDYSGGNTYGYGYCTAFVKDALGWVRNGWGNANTWASRAASQGYLVNNTPAVGAVAQTSTGGLGHVAVVIGVDGDQVTIREMNYQGWNIISSRTVHKSSFIYIHP